MQFTSTDLYSDYSAKASILTSLIYSQGAGSGAGKAAVRASGCRRVAIQVGIVWFGLVWFGLVWFGLGWFGLV